NVRRQPTLKPFGVEYAAVNRVIVTHRGERVRKAALECQVEIGPRSEHAMVVRRRGPYLRKRTLGHETLPAHGIPERAAEGAGNDLSHPAEIGVAHGDRAAAMTAPFFGLQVSEVGIPGDIDVRQRITCLREERDDLRLITLKEYDVHRQMRFVVKISPHPLPN